MITYSNLFFAAAMQDGTIRIEFKVQNPVLKNDAPIVAIVYMTKENASELANLITRIAE